MKDNNNDNIYIAAGLGVLALGIGKIIKDKKETKRRTSISISYTNLLPKELFEKIVIEEAKKIKRLYARVSNGIVYGEVKSVSGLSSWSFSLDFNDYGRISGKYWVHSENKDSTIPSVFGRNIQNSLGQYIQNE